jgi:hypothetical protein
MRSKAWHGGHTRHRRRQQLPDGMASLGLTMVARQGLKGLPSRALKHSCLKHSLAINPS